ncbi:polysaccharide deacetylase family protein [Sphingobium olei]|uniref:Chitooligosaccharide deacetylase n=1 Tax=Sphingobium olei TaxID=420955 RepID=A0ABW3P003_9SPHN
MKIKWFILGFGAASVAIAVAAAVRHRCEGFSWPGGASAAVVLTYDDGLPSQMMNVVPALDQLGLKATFFLIDVPDSRLSAWRAIAKRGHEIGNHTRFHPCPTGYTPAVPGHFTDNYPVSEMIGEIGDQERRLAKIDGKPKHSFAAPCGNWISGGKDYLEPLRHTGMVTSGRGVAASSSAAQICRSSFDRMDVPGRVFAETSSAGRMIEYIEEAERNHGLAVLVFHGVGGDHSQTSLAAHDDLLRWLGQHQRDLWITTFSQATAAASKQATRPR